MKGKFPTILKKVICPPLILVFISVPVLAQTAQQPSDYMQGKADGEAAAEGNFVWGAAGLLFGCLAVGYVYLIYSPSPPSSALVGKSGDYVQGFTEGYKKKMRKLNGSYALAGWALWLAIFNIIMWS